MSSNIQTKSANLSLVKLEFLVKLYVQIFLELNKKFLEILQPFSALSENVF